MIRATTANGYDAESFLIRRLADHGVTVYAVSTCSETTMQRIRDAINRGGLDAVIVGRNLHGKAETYEQLFHRIYGEPLIPRTRKGKP